MRGLLALLAASGYAVLAQLLRPSGVSVTQTLWAEDGRVFVAEAFQTPPQHWLTPYAGYVHLLPRLVAAVVVHAPLEQLAGWVAVLSATLATGCLVILALGLRAWLPAVWMPAAAVAAFGSLDILATETAANLANLHWFATLGLIGLVLVRIRSLAAGAVGALAALTLAATSVFSIALAPVALLGVGWRWWRCGRTAGVAYLPISVGMTAGAALQMLTTLRAPRAAPVGTDLSAAAVADTFGRLVVVRATAGLNEPPAWHAAVAAAVVVCLVAAAGLTRGSQPLSRAALVVALTSASVASFVSSVQLNNGVSDRYAVVPAILLVAALLVAIGGHRAANHVLVALTSVLFVLVAATDWAVSFPARGDGPALRDQLGDARQQCRTADEATVDIRPDGPWFVVVPCPKVLD